MIKIVHRNLPGVSNMADQGRIILQNYCVCNLSIGSDCVSERHGIRRREDVAYGQRRLWENDLHVSALYLGQGHLNIYNGGLWENDLHVSADIPVSL